MKKSQNRYIAYFDNPNGSESIIYVTATSANHAIERAKLLIGKKPIKVELKN